MAFEWSKHEAGDVAWDNALGAARLVYRLVRDDVDVEDNPETVLRELGVPGGVIEAIADKGV